MPANICRYGPSEEDDDEQGNRAGQHVQATRAELAAMSGAGLVRPVAWPAS